MKTKKVKNEYQKAVARMESEVRRAKAHVALLKMLYKEMQEKQKVSS